MGSRIKPSPHELLGHTNLTLIGRGAVARVDVDSMDAVGVEHNESLVDFMFEYAWHSRRVPVAELNPHTQIAQGDSLEE